MSELSGKTILSSETEVDYVAQREYAASRGDLNAPFGKSHLASIQYITSHIKDESRQKKELADIYTETRSFLDTAYQSPTRKQFVEQLFYDGITNPDVIQLLSTEGIDSFDSSPEVLLDKTQIPDPVLDKLLEIHIENFSKKAADFAQTLPERIDIFYDDLKRLQKVGIDTISIDNCKKRIENASIQLADGLSQRFMEQYGTYEEGTQSIYISEKSLASPELTEEALTHELLHLCSGREIIKRPNILHGFLDDEPSHHIHNLKDGLGINRIGMNQKRYRWLNEGVTQMITDLIIGKTTETYWSEKVLEAALSQKGNTIILPQLFMKAYFENYDTTVKPNDSQPVHKELFKAISDAYEPGFLATLDRYIETQNEYDAYGNVTQDGVTKTFMQLHDDWKVIARGTKDKSTTE